MMAHLSPSFALFLVVITASGYAVATIGMKIASTDGALITALGFIAVGLMGAVLAEVVLLRHASLTMVYIGIVVFESLLVLAYATYASGSVNFAQLSGAALVLGGFAIVTMTE